MNLVENDTYQVVLGLFKTHGVTLHDIAELVQAGQIDYMPNLSMDEALDSVQHVLHKTEVQDAVMTGIALDDLAEADALPEPLATRIKTDHQTYGTDENMVMAILGVYGTISWTNFGFLDRTKPGVIGKLNDIQKKGGRVNTFIDDLVAAVAAAAEARIAHE
ncbi:phosphatidylglycerophosphatase A [Weissella coleopterorum]|uniref:Phosphatidylglycerophosphatase A n=1 Tax=Weissella coleopterorum TaxID=2714949 RepID=A0A6G8AY64_9LACO|nr:phosphatidylglycerophosphatase A [Weissella coleopterorum]QIL49947.1 phosphatidylglycerophosphatase A [Weissella coleopterorum]